MNKFTFLLITISVAVFSIADLQAASKDPAQSFCEYLSSMNSRLNAKEIEISKPLRNYDANKLFDSGTGFVEEGKGLTFEDTVHVIHFKTFQFWS